MRTNALNYDHNLEMLSDHIPDKSIDLIYLDWPSGLYFSCNILFRQSTGTTSNAQIDAFEHTWHWGPTAVQTYEERKLM